MWMWQAVAEDGAGVLGEKGEVVGWRVRVEVVADGEGVWILGDGDGATFDASKANGC